MEATRFSDSATQNPLVRFRDFDGFEVREGPPKNPENFSKIYAMVHEILTQVYDEPMGPIGQGTKRLIGVDYILMDTPSQPAQVSDHPAPTDPDRERARWLTAVVGFVDSVAAIVTSITVDIRCRHTSSSFRTVQLVLLATR